MPHIEDYSTIYTQTDNYTTFATCPINNLGNVLYLVLEFKGGNKAREGFITFVDEEFDGKDIINAMGGSKQTIEVLLQTLEKLHTKYFMIDDDMEQAYNTMDTKRKL